jgi:hypothetical protein
LGVVSSVLMITSSTFSSPIVRPARPRLIEQPVEAVLGKPSPPRRGRGARDPQPLGDLGVLASLRGQQHDPRALRKRLRARAAPRPRLQLRPLVAGQFNPNSNIRWHKHLMPAAKDLMHQNPSPRRAGDC